MGRCLRSHLDQLLPDLQSHMQDKQQRQSDRHNQHTKPLPDATVLVRNFGKGDKWLPGIIIKVQGSRSYKSDSRIIRRHVDHIQSCSIDFDNQPTDCDEIYDEII